MPKERKQEQHEAFEAKQNQHEAEFKNWKRDLQVERAVCYMLIKLISARHT
jgi:hypothetical protein